jgi:methylated-DNA-[protein]-cysteine S-methyltransferase
MADTTVLNHIFYYESPIGLIAAERSNTGISRIDILDDQGKAQVRPPKDAILMEFKQQLNEYFEGRRKEFSMPLDWSGMTDFQAEVLRLTLAIPFGETLTYGDIARALGKPAGSRAVGDALAHNPLPLLIPCHRVVAASGSLTGYTAASGIKTKAWLLRLEGHRIVGEKLD